MKILHVIKLDPRAAGGIERFVDDLLAAQSASGHEVHAVGCAVDGLHELPPHAYGTTLAPTWFTLFHLPFAPGLPAVVRREIERRRPDVVHVHWPNPMVLDLARAVPAGTRLVLHWHADIDPAGAILPIRAAYALAVRRYEARLVARADAVIATSAGYVAASPVLREVLSKTHVVPIGLRPPPGAAPAAWPIEGRPRVLFIGRAVPYKSLEVLLESLASVASASLVVVGEGPRLGAWRRAARGLGVASRVHFAGRVPEAAKQALLAACDVLCLPSSNRLEAFGVVLLEAAAACRPVVAAEVPGSGVAEVARSIAGSRTFPVRDAAALAAALACYPDPAATDAALAPRYTIDAVAGAVDRVYASLVR